jgi:N-acetylneuraminate synthase
VTINFIAEVSSNHSRNLKRSIEFINVAADIGCESVKFQLFKIDSLFAPEILRHRKDIAQRKKWELPDEFLEPLSNQCKERSIKFSCTPFYIEAVEKLLPYVDFYKIASYELLWDELLTACAQTGKPMIVSTGMATIDEIQHAVDVIKSNGCKKLTLLHCTSSYPTPYKEANLSAIQTIRDFTGCEVGWSDHTVNSGVIHRSIHKWGAKVVEFHLDLEGDGEEYDSGHCWLPSQIGQVIEQVNNGLQSDGDGIKEPIPCEIQERLWRADPSDGMRPFKSIRKTFTS